MPPAPLLSLPRRVLLPVVLLGLLVGLTACGGEDPTIRVRLLVAPADAPLDVEAFLHATEGRQKRYPLHAVAGEPGVYAAEAPSGAYMVEVESGWRHLDIQGRASRLTAGAGLAPIDFYLGRAGTMYVTMKERASPPPSLTWAVERDAFNEGRTAVPAEVYQAFDKLVGIRVAPADWRGALRFTGTAVDGALCSPFVVDVGTPGKQFPFLRLITPAPVSGYSVRLVPPSGSKPVPDGYQVEVALRRTAVPFGQQGASASGVVAFARVPRLADGLRVSAGPTVIDLGGAHHGRYEAVHLLALPTQGFVDVRLSGGEDRSIDEVRVRPEKAHQYALALLKALPGDPHTYSVRTASGPQHWLVRSGAEWAALKVVPGAQDSAPVEVTGWLAGAQIRGDVSDGRGARSQPIGPGHRLLLVRVEGETEVLGEGFDTIIDRHARYRVDVPPGTYRLRVQGQHGLLGKASEMRVAPGSEVRRTIDIE